MELTTEQIEFIQKDIEQKGIAMNDLAESLLDHICCSIENSTDRDFNHAYENALKAFGQNGLQKIQDETIFLLILKREITMQKSMYILGYIAAFLATTGLLFKLMHWPGANIMLVLGIALLNLGFPAASIRAYASCRWARWWIGPRSGRGAGPGRALHGGRSGTRAAGRRPHGARA